MKFGIKPGDNVPKRYGFSDCLYFGKYQYRPIGNIMQTDPKYLAWIYKKMKNFKFKQEVIFELMQKNLI